MEVDGSKDSSGVNYDGSGYDYNKGKKTGGVDLVNNGFDQKLLDFINSNYETTLENAIKTSEKNLKEKIDNDIKEIDKKFDDRQVKSIEVLGIFVTLFSFISVNVQIFNKVSSAVEAGLFMVLIFCCLSALVLLLDILLKPIPVDPVPVKIKKTTNIFKRFFLYGKYYLWQIFRDTRSLIAFIILIIGISSIYFLKDKILNKYPDDPNFNKAVEEKTKNFYSKEEINFLLQENKQNIKDYTICVWYKGIGNCSR